MTGLSADHLFDILGRAGFKLELNGDDIRISPSSRLNDSLRRAIKEKKVELLALLRARAALSTVPPLDPGPKPELPWLRKLILCFACRARGCPSCQQCTLINDPALVQREDGVICNVGREAAREWRQRMGYPTD